MIVEGRWALPRAAEGNALAGCARRGDRARPLRHEEAAIKKTHLFAVLAILLSLAFLPAGPASPVPRIFVVQTDSMPIMGELDFDKGFAALLRRLPPEDPVLVFGFHLNNVYPLAMGRAGEIHWPPKGFRFVSASGNTTPYKDILAVLVHWKIRNATVWVLTTGRCRELEACMKVEGANDFQHSSLRPDMYSASSRPLVLDGRDFDPVRYRPLAELLRYVCEQNVKVNSVFLWKNPKKDLFMEDGHTGSSFFGGDMRYFQHCESDRVQLRDNLGFTALTLLAQASGGAIFSEFGSFQGLFRNIAP